MFLLFALVFSEICSANKEICISPINSGSNVSVEVSFKPLDTNKYIAFGFGGNGMSKSEIVAFTKTDSSYLATGYYATGYSKPLKNNVTWTTDNVKVSDRVIVTISRSKASVGAQSNDFPNSDATFIWATGDFTNNDISKHSSGNNGQFSMTSTDKSSTASATIFAFSLGLINFLF
jgi:hypothetical protein